MAIVLAGGACLLMAHNARAEKPLDGFIPLHGKHTDARGKPVPPMRSAEASFIPLNARSFRGLPQARRELPTETAEPVALSENLAPSANTSLMSTEQAQQIISIFAPNQ